MSEMELLRAVQLKASEMGHRLWRNNNGVGWVGLQTRVNQPTMVRMYPGDVLIRKAMVLHAGLCPGSSDLVGISNNGLFIGAEIKAPKGRLRDGQPSFIDQIRSMGGIGLIIRTLEDFKV